MPLTVPKEIRQYASFGEAIKGVRTEQGLKLRALARMAGMSGTYLSHVEKGRCPAPAVVKIRKLAKVLDVDFIQLLRLADRGPELAAEIVKERPELLAVLLDARAEQGGTNDVRSGP